MDLLKRISLRKTGLLLLAILGFLWISLEGDVRWSGTMALITLLVSFSALVHRVTINRQISSRVWVIVFGICGLLIGILFAPTTLLFMTIKTGLHGHGPEFTPNEMAWFTDRLILWSLAGLLGGAGLGFIFVGFRGSQVERGVVQAD